MDKNEQWEHSVRITIEGMADFDLVYKSWKGQEGLLSSPGEESVILYDDCLFIEFLDYYKNLYGKDELYYMFLKLDKEFNYFKAFVNAPPDLILKNGYWDGIASISAKILDMWPEKKEL